MIDLSGKHLYVIGQDLVTASILTRMIPAGATLQGMMTVHPTLGKLETEGVIDIAVISARWAYSGASKPFLDTFLTEWREAFTINFEQVILAAQMVAKHMIARQTAGRIIIVSSVAGLKSYRNLSHVGTSVAALHATARIAAVDLGAYGITINVIAIGQADLLPEDPSKIPDYFPLGRTLVNEDIGDVCCFLASDQASYITGAIIPVDGGYSITKAGASTIKKRQD